MVQSCLDIADGNENDDIDDEDYNDNDWNDNDNKYQW